MALNRSMDGDLDLSADQRRNRVSERWRVERQMQEDQAVAL
jgi:hypothetical protein